jgi:membrane protease YdiL (CAAX protease family)
LDEINPGLDLLKPTNNNELVSWVFVNMIASVCEEIIFRSVLYYFFLQTTENHWAAATLCALVFGFSHGVQGTVGMVITAVLGFGLQHVVLLNDGLMLASIVHFLYNMGTTYFVLKRKKQTNKSSDEDSTPTDDSHTESSQQ